MTLLISLGMMLVITLLLGFMFSIIYIIMWITDKWFRDNIELGFTVSGIAIIFILLTIIVYLVRGGW